MPTSNVHWLELDAVAGVVPVPGVGVVDASTKELRIKLVFALNEAEDLRLHVQRLALGVATCDNPDAWVEAGLVDALLQLLKSLPGEHLSREDAPSVCAAAVATLHHVASFQYFQANSSSSGSSSRSTRNSRHLVAALASDKEAWAALIKWGLRSSAATQPLSVDVSMLLLPGHRMSGPKHECWQWSARIFNLALACETVNDMQCMQAQWDEAFPRLQPAVREAVLEHVLEYLASHMSATVWATLVFLARRVDETARLLRKLLPQLRLALDFHGRFLADPANRAQLRPELDHCIAEPLDLIHHLVKKSPRPVGRSADPCWDLFLVALDTALQVVADAEQKDPGFGDKATSACVAGVNTLVRFAEDKECMPTGQALLARGQRLCCWVGLAHRLPTHRLRMLVLVLAMPGVEATSTTGGQGQVPHNVQISEQLLTHAVDGLAACHADLDLKAMVLYILYDAVRAALE